MSVKCLKLLKFKSHMPSPAILMLSYMENWSYPIAPCTQLEYLLEERLGFCAGKLGKPSCPWSFSQDYIKPSQGDGYVFSLRWYSEIEQTRCIQKPGFRRLNPSLPVTSTCSASPQMPGIRNDLTLQVRLSPESMQTHQHINIIPCQSHTCTYLLRPGAGVEGIGRKISKQELFSTFFFLCLLPLLTRDTHKCLNLFLGGAG